MLVLEPQLCLICLSKCSHSLWFAAPLSWVAHPIVGSSFQVFSSFWQPVFIIRCRNIMSLRNLQCYQILLWQTSGMCCKLLGTADAEVPLLLSANMPDVTALWHFHQVLQKPPPKPQSGICPASPCFSTWGWKEFPNQREAQRTGTQWALGSDLSRATDSLCDLQQGCWPACALCCTAGKWSRKRKRWELHWKEQMQRFSRKTNHPSPATPASSSPLQPVQLSSLHLIVQAKSSFKWKV